jgi:anti-sigma-K factor RskA
VRGNIVKRKDRHIEDLLPAYALGSLDREELEAVQKHLRNCASCRSALTKYEEVVGELGLALPPGKPPPGLKEQVLANLKSKPGFRLRSAAEWLGRTRSFPNAAVVWAAAGVLVVAFLIAFNVLVWLRLQHMQSAPGHLRSQMVELNATPSAPAARGVVIYHSGESAAALIVEDLPALSYEQQYQLWLIGDNERTSGGVFSVSPQGYATLKVSTAIPIDSYQAFGVTVEPAGGSTDPTGPKVLGSEK